MVSPQPQLSMTGGRALEFVAQHQRMALATNGADEWPHVVAVTYVFIDGRLATTSRLRSHKVANLRRDPGVTGLVEDGQSYDTRRGVMVSGTAELASDAEEVRGVIRAILATDRLGEAALPLSVDRMAEHRAAIYVRPLGMVTWDHARVGRPTPRPVHLGVAPMMHALDKPSKCLLSSNVVIRRAVKPDGPPLGSPDDRQGIRWM